MENGKLPKSLHTVRVLVNVAVFDRPPSDNFETCISNALRAARICGHTGTPSDDPLIVAAARQLQRVGGFNPGVLYAQNNRGE